MRKYGGLLAGVLVCAGVIIIGYQWAMSMIGSLYDYRSPIKDSAPATLPPLGEPVDRTAGLYPGGWTSRGYRAR